MEEIRQSNTKEAQKAVELDSEISQSQEYGGRRGSNASLSTGYCFGSAILEQFIAMEGEQAKQQLAIFQGEFQRVLSCNISQSPPHQHTEGAEDNREKSNHTRKAQEKSGNRSREVQ